MTTNAKSNDFVGSEPIWKTTFPKNSGVYDGTVLTGINSPTAETRHTDDGNGTTSVKAFDKEFGVKVVVVEVNKTKQEITPPFGLNGIFSAITNTVNQAGKVLKFGPCSDFEIKPKIVSSRSNYNEEDKSKPIYYNTTIYDIGLDVSFSGKCGKNTELPLIGKTANDVIKKYINLEVYIKPSVGFSLVGAIKYRQLLSKGEDSYFSNTVSASLKGGVEAGIDFKLLDNKNSPVNITAEIKGKTAIELKGQFEYIIQEKKFKPKLEFILKPLVLSGGVSIKTNEQKIGDKVVFPKITLIDIKTEYNLLDEVKFKIYGE